MPVPEEVEVDIAPTTCTSMCSEPVVRWSARKYNGLCSTYHPPSGWSGRRVRMKSPSTNKAKAMKVLATRLLEAKQAAAHEGLAEQRRQQVGSGDRSEQSAPTTSHKTVSPITASTLRSTSWIESLKAM